MSTKYTYFVHSSSDRKFAILRLFTLILCAIILQVDNFAIAPFPLPLTILPVSIAEKGYMVSKRLLSARTYVYVQIDQRRTLLTSLVQTWPRSCFTTSLLLFPQSSRIAPVILCFSSLAVARASSVASTFSCRAAFAFDN